MYNYCIITTLNKKMLFKNHRTYQFRFQLLMSEVTVVMWQVEFAENCIVLHSNYTIITTLNKKMLFKNHRTYQFRFQLLIYEWGNSNQVTDRISQKLHNNYTIITLSQKKPFKNKKYQFRFVCSRCKPYDALNVV